MFFSLNILSYTICTSIVKRNPDLSEVDTFIVYSTYRSAFYTFKMTVFIAHVVIGGRWTKKV